MALLVVAFIGLVGPNGLFLYWLFVDFNGIATILQDKLAIAFITDAFLATGVLAFLFARSPIGEVRWPWFVMLSLAGGLGFSIPFYVWLNRAGKRS
jgi:hypothetical protein